MTHSVTDDIAAGLAARHQGQAAVLAADQSVNRDYAPTIRIAIEQAMALGPFDADKVRRLAAEHERINGRDFEPHPNLIGSLIGTYARAERIRRVGEVNSARRTRHASRNAIWRAA